MTIWDGPGTLDVDFRECVRCGAWIQGNERGMACLACLVTVMAGDAR